MSLLHYIQEFDAVHGIPRPMTAPHLTAYHAALHCLRTAAEMIGLALCGALSAYLIWVTANNLKAEFELRLIFVGGMLMAISLSLIEALQLLLPYYRLKQRLTHGSAMWADTAWLKSEGFAQDFTTSLRPGELQLGTPEFVSATHGLYRVCS